MPHKNAIPFCHVGGRGFTLIELMVVVAVIGVLAAIALPKFGELLNRSRESGAQGALGALRSAISIYYSDNEGSFPSSLDALVTQHIMNFIPEAAVPSVTSQGNPGHSQNGNVEYYDSVTPTGSSNEGVNLWAYVNTGPEWGHLVVNCTHRNTKGVVWSNN